MSKIVIFGLLDCAELAHFYFKHDSPHEVVAFTVNEEYLPQGRTFKGLPVVAFEEIQDTYNPADYQMFVAMTSGAMNKNRERVYNMVKEKGYTCVSYISSRASIFPEAQIGENCLILEDNTLQPFTPVGNDVILWSGNHIGHHGLIKDHVMFTSHVVLSGRCIVEPYCFFGVNATIRDYLHIAEGSLIAMGALVTRDTEPWGIYKGCPAVRQPGTSNENCKGLAPRQPATDAKALDEKVLK